ncbi:MAG TPA: WYL domain-containing protein [Kofleriaceae bacterium]|nr:WYL domain-containing protein [Kofleriaceae bacterium]
MRASRLVSILMLLQSRGRVSARTLAEHLEVSVRTVYRDIDELSAAGVPVVVERGALGGFELLDGWRTTLTGLTPDESQTLFLSGLPGPVAELGLADTMASAHLKLLAALPAAWQVEAQRVSSRFHVDLAGWYRRVKPVEHLRALADAVWADRRVTIRYESWQGLVDRELEPLGLVIKAGEWYLAAQPRAPGGARSRTGTPRTYRVSNIRELAIGGEFARPAAFDLAAYWSESTRRFEREINRSTADVRLSPRGRKLLCSASAAIEEAVEAAIEQATRAATGAAPRGSDGWLRVTIPIESLGHATGQLLALGSDVEVLGPPELRQRVRDTARAVAAIYAARRPTGRPRPRRRRTR